VQSRPAILLDLNDLSQVFFCRHARLLMHNPPRAKLELDLKLDVCCLFVDSSVFDRIHSFEFLLCDKKNTEVMAFFFTLSSSLALDVHSISTLF